MIAVFVEGGHYVNGWLQNVMGSEGYLEGLDFVLFDEMPEVIINNPGKRFTINKDTKEITVIEEPQMPPNNVERIEQLELENEELKARLLDIEMFAADLISGGGV